MTPEQIQRMRTREPFLPFRIRLQDGRSYDVLRRDLILVTPHTLSIGIRVDPADGLPEQIVHVSPQQVVSVEQVEPASR
jgi:hypothetical protein